MSEREVSYAEPRQAIEKVIGSYVLADEVIGSLDAAGFAIVPREATQAMIEAAPRTVCRVADIWSEMVKAAVAETN